MGSTEFLVGLNSSSPTSLPQSIYDLENTSIIFMQRWRRGDHRQAGEVSREAMIHLDFIVNELLREKVDRLGSGSYNQSPFASQMNDPMGYGVTNITRANQISMVSAGPGNGRIPASIGTPVNLSFERLLNKIKHRNGSLINFRIENERHIFVICPEHTAGGAEGIYEFDVGSFCAKCTDAAAVM